MRRGGPAGRVRGHRMTGGTPKEVHWTAEQQKRPQRTYRGRKRRETAAKGSTMVGVSGPKMSCLSTPPKIRLSSRSHFFRLLVVYESSSGKKMGNVPLLCLFYQIDLPIRLQVKPMETL